MDSAVLSADVVAGVVESSSEYFITPPSLIEI